MDELIFYATLDRLTRRYKGDVMAATHFKKIFAELIGDYKVPVSKNVPKRLRREFLDQLAGAMGLTEYLKEILSE